MIFQSRVIPWLQNSGWKSWNSKFRLSQELYITHCGTKTSQHLNFHQMIKSLPLYSKPLKLWIILKALRLHGKATGILQNLPLNYTSHCQTETDREVKCQSDWDCNLTVDFSSYSSLQTDAVPLWRRINLCQPILVEFILNFDWYESKNCNFVSETDFFQSNSYTFSWSLSSTYVCRIAALSASLLQTWHKKSIAAAALWGKSWRNSIKNVNTLQKRFSFSLNQHVMTFVWHNLRDFWHFI